MTSRGEAIVAKPLTVLHEARTLLEIAHGDGQDLVGHFRLGAIPTLGPYLLPFAIRTIRQAFPSKRALFDIGVAGPIAGFLALLPFLFWGVSMSVMIPF